MDYLEQISLGFQLGDRKLIYSSLLDYFVKYRKKVVFQKHPLGFKYHKLGKISSFAEFRLHFWINTDDIQDKDLQVHDHSFNFTSFVVNGQIINTKYKPIQKPNSNGYIYEVKFENEKSDLILNKKDCYLHEAEISIVNQGEFYKMVSNEFHETKNIEEFTITLLKIYKPQEKIARVFSLKKLDRIPSFKRTTLNAKENLQLTNEIIRLINFDY